MSDKQELLKQQFDNENTLGSTTPRKKSISWILYGIILLIIWIGSNVLCYKIFTEGNEAKAQQKEFTVSSVKVVQDDSLPYITGTVKNLALNKYNYTENDFNISNNSRTIIGSELMNILIHIKWSKYMILYNEMLLISIIF